jgi:esterase/lipase superfamily enzyme
MKSEFHTWHSPSLRQDMSMKVYGHYGKPLLVFPAGGGSSHEFEDFGMVEACRPFIDEGRVKIFTVDSVDNQSWLNRDAHPRDRAFRHEEYERYILDEVVPFVHSHCHNQERFLLTGCSMGGFHAANFQFRFPAAFNGMIALSGVYGPGYFIGDYMDEHTAPFFPTLYLRGLSDPHTFHLLRSSAIIVCVGQGAWERAGDYDCLYDAALLREILSDLQIPAWVDVWGLDVSHDWPWWKVQLPYFLGKLGL